MISRIRRKLRYEINKNSEDLKFRLSILIIDRKGIRHVDILNAIDGRLLNKDKAKSIIEYRGYCIYVHIEDGVKIEVDGCSTPGNFISFIREISERISKINGISKVSISLETDHYVDWDKPAIKDSERSYHVNSFMELDKIIDKYIKDQYNIFK